MDWGNGSDVTSALCNVVMAGAAAFAAFNARSWFSQRSHSKGLDFAEEIISDIDKFFKFIEDVSGDIAADYDYIKKIAAFGHYEKFKNNSYFSSLIDKYEKQPKLTRDTLYQYSVIERWSIEVRNKDEISLILRNFEIFFHEVKQFYVEALEINDLMQQRFDTGEGLTKFEVYKERVDSSLKIVNDLYHEFKEHKFSHFFSVK